MIGRRRWSFLEHRRAGRGSNRIPAMRASGQTAGSTTAPAHPVCRAPRQAVGDAARHIAACDNGSGAHDPIRSWRSGYSGHLLRGASGAVGSSRPGCGCASMYAAEADAMCASAPRRQRRAEYSGEWHKRHARMWVRMHADRGKESARHRAIAFLAEESQVPIDEVAQLYEDERAELEVGARITGFLPIFAVRKVRALLRQRSTGKRQPA